MMIQENIAVLRQTRPGGQQPPVTSQLKFLSPLLTPLYLRESLATFPSMKVRPLHLKFWSAEMLTVILTGTRMAGMWRKGLGTSLLILEMDCSRW